MNCVCLGWLLVSLLLSAAGLWAAPIPAKRLSPAEQRVSRKLESLRNSPSELYALLLKMPKGGDLHHHLAGGAYAEDIVGAAAAQDLCVEKSSWSFVPRSASGQCADGQMDAKTAAQQNAARNLLVDGMSMRDFVASQESPHDHFFASFGKFQAVERDANAGFLTQVIRRAAEQNESYLELMALSGGAALTVVAEKVTYTENFESNREQLMKAGLSAVVAELKSRVDELEKRRVAILGCDKEPNSQSCRLVVRYAFQVLRESPKEQVFAQILAGFMLAAEDPRVVSANLVQPEDGLISMRDYHFHMQMIQYVRSLYPKVLMTLHAGELALGLVPPEGLRFHIREALEFAHAERIGHGVDLNYERDPEEILKIMRERRTAVEINLSSNDVILGVRGNGHPLPTYRKAGVPVVLCTDDEGVSRTHLTQEYLRATLTYNLTYSDLKEIARNSLEFSFLDGESFWRAGGYLIPAAACAAGRQTSACTGYLAENSKARLQADLEARFEAFEALVR